MLELNSGYLAPNPDSPLLTLTQGDSLLVPDMAGIHPRNPDPVVPSPALPAQRDEPLSEALSSVRLPPARHHLPPT